MKALDLPEPIAAYFDADRHDGQAVARCFTRDGLVLDEGHTHSGLAAIDAAAGQVPAIDIAVPDQQDARSGRVGPVDDDRPHPHGQRPRQPVPGPAQLEGTHRLFRLAFAEQHRFAESQGLKRGR